MDGSYTGIINRIVDREHVVFEITNDGKWVGEVITSVDNLEENCRYEGALFEVIVEDGEFVAARHLPEKEKYRKNRISEKSKRLGEPLDNKKE